MDYAWPGNVRELVQCVCNILIRRAYHPSGHGTSPVVADAPGTLAHALEESQLTADAMLTRYCTLVYARTGSYLAAARHLGLDRRTIKSRIDPALLEQLQA